MKIVIQRSREASLAVEGLDCGSIEKGLVVFIGFAEGDVADSLPALVQKIIQLRVFDDADGKPNLSLQDIEGGLIIVPNFTLLGSSRKGRRPSFVKAAAPETARPLFESFCSEIQKSFPHNICGDFGTHMEVLLLNDGPYTLLMDWPEPRNKK